MLIAAGMVGAFAVIPHLLQHLAQFFGCGVLLAVAVAAGNWLAPGVGLTSPIVDAVLTGRSFVRRTISVSGIAIGLGAATAVVLVVVELAVFIPLVQRTSATSTPLWVSVLVALYGGLTEEILFRYGVMSLLAWLLTRVARGPAAYWGAIVGAAVASGLGYIILDTTSALLPSVVTHAPFLNGIGGLAFGWLYWRRGLEAAMVSHGATVLVLYVALAMVPGR